jgi:rhodanese-related sulfurtransferase
MKLFYLLFSSLFGFFVSAANISDISGQELLSLDTSDWLILDVRSAQEYQQGHVPGAINIAHTDISQQVDQLLPFKDNTIVLYCRSGYRANKAATVLLGMAFSKLKHLDGDMLEWQKSGAPIKK